MSDVAAKHCGGCDRDRPFDAFYRCSGRKDGHATQCKECANKRSREWALKHPERHKKYQRKHYQANAEHHRDQRLRRSYGISATEYEALLTAQNGVCALCYGTDAPRRLAVDHCHETGSVRGLLCLQCNTAMGKLGDSLDGVRRVITYLEGSCRA